MGRIREAFDDGDIVSMEEIAAALFQILTKARQGRVKADLIVDEEEFQLLVGSERQYKNGQGEEVYTKHIFVPGSPFADVRLTWLP